MIKWIGQHIVDFIARFRSDVYLEDIADGTVADNKFLGLDSNNKIVKEAASATVTDLHSAGVDGSANQLLTDDGDGTVTSEANLLFHNDTLVLTSTSAAGRPHLTLQNDETSSASPILQFEKTATGADGDDLGRIIFKGDDEGDGSHTYANILGEIADATPGEEAGRLSLQVAEFDGTVTTGVLINGDTDADGEVDVTIGAGAASTTTIAGDLIVTGGDITIGTTAGELVSTGQHILKQTKVTIDTAGFNGLNSTPVELVAAQGANKVIVPTEVVLFHDRASTQSNSVDLIVGFNGTTSYLTAVKYMRRYMQSVTTDRTMKMGDYGYFANDLTTAVNSNLTIALGGAPTTNCVTSLTVYTSYYVIDIS